MQSSKCTRVYGFVPSFQHTTYIDTQSCEQIPSFPSSSPSNSSATDSQFEHSSEDEESDNGVAIKRRPNSYLQEYCRRLSRTEVKYIEHQLNTENARRYCAMTRKRA